jgi:HEAT repeat protein
MKTRLLIGLSVILGVVALTLYYFGREPGSPTYQGKSLDYWFKQRLTKNSPEADKILNQVGPEAVPYLRTVLRREDSFLTRTRSALRRKMITSKLVPAAVRQRLTIPVTALRARAEAARILRGLGPAARPALPELVASLNHKQRGIRSTAFEALIGLGPAVEGVIPVVLQTLKHPDSSMRMRAATALSEFEVYSPGIIAALTEALADPLPMVRQAAVQTLAQAGPAAISALPQLGPMLNERDNYLRLSAADALWRISPEQARVIVPLLIGLMDPEASLGDAPDLSLEFRVAAVEIMGEMGPLAKEAVPALRRLLHKGPDDHRFGAANALRKIEPTNGPALVPLFVQFLAATDAPVARPEVIEALGEIGPAATEAVPTLTRYLDDEDEMIRLTSAIALWRIDPRQADLIVPVLVKLLKHDIEAELDVSDALEALKEMGPAAREAVPVVRALLVHPAEDLRHAAAEALKRIEGDGRNGR